MPSSKEFSDTAALGQPQDEIDPTDPYGESADAAASTKTLQQQQQQQQQPVEQPTTSDQTVQLPQHSPVISLFLECLDLIHTARVPCRSHHHGI